MKQNQKYGQGSHYFKKVLYFRHWPNRRGLSQNNFWQNTKWMVLNKLDKLKWIHNNDKGALCERENILIDKGFLTKPAKIKKTYIHSFS